MLVDFTVRNFRSFRDEIKLSMEAIDDDYNSDNYEIVELRDGRIMKLLKFAGIFGANASGKSNVTLAFASLYEMIIYSKVLVRRQLIPNYEPFALNFRNKAMPTTYILHIIERGELYEYQVIHDRRNVLEESLSICNENSKKYIFYTRKESETDNEVIIDESIKRLKSLIESYRENKVKSNSLFISLIGEYPENELTFIYQSLKKLHPIVITDDIKLQANINEIASVVYGNKTIEQRLNKLLRIADLGISNMNIKKNGISSFRFPRTVSARVRNEIIKEYQWDVRLRHKHIEKVLFSSSFEFAEESTGTKHLLDLATRIFGVLESGGVMVMDEMNLAIHPVLFKLLVSMFQQKKSNPKNAQLIFTTHDTTIMNDGFMRADQVWFTEKKSDGASDLFCAIDFEGVSINTPFENWYRSGRFGAIPILQSIDKIFDDEDIR